MSFDVRLLESFFSVLNAYGDRVEQYNDKLSWKIKSNSAESKQNLRDNNIVFEQSGSDLIIELDQQRFGVQIKFFPEDELSKAINPSDIEKPFVLLGNNFSFIYHDLSQEPPYKTTNASGALNRLYHNCIAYYRLYNEFKKDTFAHHHDDSKLHIVLYSSSRGIFKIQYDAEIPLFDYDIEGRVQDLLYFTKELFLKVYLVHAIIDCSSNKSTCHIRDIITNSNLIVDNAKQGYELAIKQFDFDKFRNSLQKEKEKYFSNVRDIANKFFSQIIAIPISASATAFASYKADGDVFLNSLILVGFLLFTILYVLAQYTYYADLKLLRADFGRDFDHIKQYSGLNANEIDSERNKLQIKIENSTAVIFFSIIAVILVNLGIICYVVRQIINV